MAVKVASGHRNLFTGVGGNPLLLYRQLPRLTDYLVVGVRGKTAKKDFALTDLFVLSAPLFSYGCDR